MPLMGVSNKGVAAGKRPFFSLKLSPRDILRVKEMGKPALAAGVLAALTTPRRSSSIEVDTAALFDYVDAVTSGGVSGVVLFGTTGEFVHFDIEERLRVAALVIKRSRIPVIVNVTHSSLPGAVTLGEDALASGAAGVLLAPPYFFRYEDEQVLSFYQQFSRLANAKGRPASTYLYNIPAFTNGVSAPVAKELLASGEFAGIKDSSSDWQYFEELAAWRKQYPFQLLTGSEPLYRQSNKAGGDGIISGVAAALPELVVALGKALRSCDERRCNRLHDFLVEYVDRIRPLPAPYGIRLTATVRKWIAEEYAIPPSGTLARDLEELRRWLAGWLPQVLNECQAGQTVGRESS